MGHGHGCLFFCFSRMSFSSMEASGHLSSTVNPWLNLCRLTEIFLVSVKSHIWVLCLHARYPRANLRQFWWAFPSALGDRRQLPMRETEEKVACHSVSFLAQSVTWKFLWPWGPRSRLQHPRLPFQLLTLLWSHPQSSPASLLQACQLAHLGSTPPTALSLHKPLLSTLSFSTLGLSVDFYLSWAPISFGFISALQKLSISLLRWLLVLRGLSGTLPAAPSTCSAILGINQHWAQCPRLVITPTFGSIVMNPITIVFVSNPIPIFSVLVWFTLR